MANFYKNNDSILKGKKKPPGTGKKISAKLKGRKFTKEHRENLSKSRRKHFEHLMGRKYLDKHNGYVKIYMLSHPSATPRHPYIAEHRLVMEKHIGRYLERHEQVHHKNGIRDDNRLSNLQIVTMNNHFGKVCCPFCQKKFLIK